MKTIVTLLFVLSSAIMNAQLPKMEPTDPQIKEEAYDLTDTYNQHLGLTGIQYPLFREVAQKYLTKRNTALDELKGREQLDMLVELQAEETLEMNDILTRQQLLLYKKIKPDIQPLKIVGE